MQKSKIIIWFLFLLSIMVLSLLDLRGVLKTYLPNQDKYFHLLVFAILVPTTRAVLKNTYLTFILFGIFLFGLSIEFMQLFFSNGVRKFHGADLVFNVIGIGVGLILLFAYRGVKRYKVYKIRK